MGILNVTPDSFSDGGRFDSLDSAVERALTLVQNGASIIDVGGVSTRPGSAVVNENDELKRVLPIAKALRKKLPSDTLISLDSYTPSVAEACAKLGVVDIINDVYAGRFVLEKVSTIDVAAQYQLGFVTMHMQGTPQTMQTHPHYENCTDEVAQFLRKSVKTLKERGIVGIAVDPGIGFGKTIEHNLELLSEPSMQILKALGAPLLIGLSRKRFLKEVGLSRGTGDLSLPESRDAITKDFELQALRRGAKIIRTHVMPQEIGFQI